MFCVLQGWPLHVRCKINSERCIMSIHLEIV
jgi:hypothetical protein